MKSLSDEIPMNVKIILVELSAENLAWDLVKDSQSDFPVIPSFFSTLSDCTNLMLHHTDQHVAEFFSLSVSSCDFINKLSFEVLSSTNLVQRNVIGTN